MTASDGGYTLLGLPASAGRATFEGVKWSDAQTFKGQKRALEVRSVLTSIGGTHHDVDEADDVEELERRCTQGTTEVSGNVLRSKAVLDSHPYSWSGGLEKPLNSLKYVLPRPTDYQFPEILRCLVHLFYVVILPPRRHVFRYHSPVANG